MSEQAGSSVSAIQERQAALAMRHSVVADADRVLADTLASAHAVLRDSLDRLAAVADEIERAVSGQADLAVDTALGARELQKFLVAKQREISAVVAGAREQARAQEAVLQSLQAHYSGSPS
ncbi:MAG: DUF4226 domain-containing protein [Mycobacterium sp.]|uniref:DUF4226 domain-containing protein n=1 Tax=Mycobacterium sp. TaxID=1785 RepID=UPI001EB9A5A7|nr:DUF4226 domain-containing protein [Mycobacterium sp.]MBW0017990.1 DUF4226 domain-containing protein [Mycobacterium sp.]